MARAAVRQLRLCRRSFRSHSCSGTLNSTMFVSSPFLFERSALLELLHTTPCLSRVNETLREMEVDFGRGPALLCYCLLTAGIRHFDGGKRPR